jgi:anti-anti-sigma factor
MEGLDFDLTVERVEGGALRVVVRGELDLASASRLEAALAGPSTGDGRGTVTVDLRGLTFMDSTGVRALLQATEDAGRAGTDLRFLLPEAGGARLTLDETGVEALLPRPEEPR